MKLTCLYVPPLTKQPLVEVMRRIIAAFDIFNRANFKEYSGFPLKKFEEESLWEDLLEEEVNQIVKRYGSPFVCFVPADELFGYAKRHGSFVFTGGTTIDQQPVAMLGAYFTARIFGMEDHTEHKGLDCLMKEENLDGTMKFCTHCRKSQWNYVVKG